jgi:hypothetical protein
MQEMEELVARVRGGGGGGLGLGLGVSLQVMYEWVLGYGAVSEQFSVFDFILEKIRSIRQNGEI